MLADEDNAEAIVGRSEALPKLLGGQARPGTGLAPVSWTGWCLGLMVSVWGRIVLLFSRIFLFGREHLSAPALHGHVAVVSSGCQERPARRRCIRALRFQAAS